MDILTFKTRDESVDVVRGWLDADDYDSPCNFGHFRSAQAPTFSRAIGRLFCTTP